MKRRRSYYSHNWRQESPPMSDHLHPTPNPADARTLRLAKLQQIRRELATLPIQGAWTRIHTLGGALDMVDQVVKDVEAECLVDMVDLLPVDPMLARPAAPLLPPPGAQPPPFPPASTSPNSKLLWTRTAGPPTNALSFEPNCAFGPSVQPGWTNYSRSVAISLATPTPCPLPPRTLSPGAGNVPTRPKCAPRPKPPKPLPPSMPRNWRMTNRTNLGRLSLHGHTWYPGPVCH